MESESDLKERIAGYEREIAQLTSLKNTNNLTAEGEQRLSTLNGFSFLCRSILTNEPSKEYICRHYAKGEE